LLCAEAVSYAYEQTAAIPYGRPDREGQGNKFHDGNTPPRLPTEPTNSRFLLRFAIHLCEVIDLNMSDPARLAMAKAQSSKTVFSISEYEIEVACHNAIFSSTKLIIFEGEISRADANLKMTRIVGWLTPRSIKLTKFLSMSAEKASCSCDNPTSLLRVRSTFPKAIAGSKHFSQYIGRNVRP
jgi:hypothetical protein